jgi:group II intron reverse transcriptase/maturase
MMRAEHPGNGGCPQRDSAEHEEYAGARSIDRRETEETDGADLLERILDRGNLNRAYKRVKANKGAPGIDGMTVEDALSWLREHREELLEQIRQGKYKPQPVRRKEIPKPDGGVRKLGIPAVVDRIIQQATAQQLTPIFEPLFHDGSYGYRPNRSAQMAIQRVKEYAEQGYTQAVLVDVSKYFDTLNHDLLMNMLREEVHDKRVIELIKRFLKSGVMENGLLVKTREGSPQGGPLSPLLANIYLNKFDHEMESRGVPVVRYADDIVVLAKSPRAAERLLESSRKYLEGKLKLKMNMDKSRVVSVFAKRNFKFLGFALGKGKDGVFIRAHAKSLKKAKRKLKELTSRSQGRNVRAVMNKVKVFIRGWLGYFGIANMRNTMKEWDSWLRRRFRMYIWKQWKLPRTRVKNLMKLGVPEWRAREVAYSRKSYWRCSAHASVQAAISNKRLAQAGYFSILDQYESLHLYG